MLMQNPAALFSTDDASGFGLLGMFGTPAAAPAADAASAFSALFAQMTQNLGQPVEDIEVLAQSGEAVEEDATDTALLSIQQTITIIYEELTSLSEAGIELGEVGSAQELAFAYREMGMEPEEAARRAIQVTTILAVLDQRLQSGADMGSAVVDPSLLLQVQDMLAPGADTLVKSRSLSVFAGIALTASIDGNLAERILKGENLSQDLGSIVSRTLQALGVSAEGEGSLAEIVEDGRFDALLQNGKSQQSLTDALLALNAEAEVPLSDADIAEIAEAAQKLVADVRAGGAAEVDQKLIAKLAAQPVAAQQATAEGIAQSAARAADAAHRIRTDITATIEESPDVAEVVSQGSPPVGSSAERAAPPPRIPPCGTRR